MDRRRQLAAIQQDLRVDCSKQIAPRGPPDVAFLRITDVVVEQYAVEVWEIEAFSWQYEENPIVADREAAREAFREHNNQLPRL